MKTLVICRPRPGVLPADIARHAAAEMAGLAALKADGLLVEAYSPGGPGAILVFPGEPAGSRGCAGRASAGGRGTDRGRDHRAASVSGFVLLTARVTAREDAGLVVTGRASARSRHAAGSRW